MSETPTFRTVLRGYEPTQVEQRMAELVRSLHASQDRAGELSRELEAVTRRMSAEQLAHAEAVRRVQEEARTAAAASASAHARAEAAARALTEREQQAPTFADLGERVGQILLLAEEEAAELVARAEAEAATSRRDAEAAAARVRAEADRYDKTIRGDAATEVQRLTTEALRRADDVLDASERDAKARREEAEALWENQRAKAAQAAADFELTLAGRRERAEQDFLDRTAAAEEQLASVERAASQARALSEREVVEAAARARRVLEDAQQEAAQLVSEARERADRIRAESDRELSAASQRRDSINAQLTNVRQMLATLSGSAPVIGLQVPADLAQQPTAPGPAQAAPRPAATRPGPPVPVQTPVQTPVQRPVQGPVQERGSAIRAAAREAAAVMGADEATQLIEIPAELRQRSVDVRQQDAAVAHQG